MNFFTAQYCAKETGSISLVVQHCEYAGEQICFACIANQDMVTEGLYVWFREEILGRLSWKKRNCMKKAAKRLRKKRKELGTTTPCDAGEASLAFVLCKGEEFLAFERGDIRIFSLNTAFGKSHLEYLQDREERNDFCHGTLEEDVAFLLVTGEFCRRVGEDLLQEVLFVREARQEWQMEKRLRELVSERACGDTKDMGAVLVRSSGKISANEQRMKVSERASFTRQASRPVREEALCADFCWGKKLGEGAFSQVIKVQDKKTGKVYACKKSRNISMLRREYSVGKVLTHPLFPKMYGFWREGDWGYLLMEFVPGTDVKSMLEKRKCFSERQTIYMGMELAEGLLYLHERKEALLFRDVKPENIIIRQDGRVKLLDLGCVCSKDAWENSLAGSPGFAAPEQFAEGSILNETCDVYALARTMEKMLGEKSAKSKKLRKLLTICTDADARKRLPDMRIFLNLLGELGEKAGWRCSWRRKKYRELYYDKRGILFHKNIWERNDKTLDVS